MPKKSKKDTRKRILNPRTGRKVLATGTLGKAIKQIRKLTKKPTKAKKSTKKPTKKTNATKKVKKSIQKPSRKVRQSRGMANFINRIEGRKVMKVTKKGDIRLSAGQAYRDGARIGSRHCYGGKCKILKLDKNKRAYWG